MTAVPVPAAPPAAAHVYVPDLGLSLPLLLDVPDAGALAGMSRWASYRAATDGTIRVAVRRLPRLRGQRVRGRVALGRDVRRDRNHVVCGAVLCGLCLALVPAGVGRVHAAIPGAA